MAAAAAAGGAPPAAAPCWGFAQGACRFGDLCRFAHGAGDNAAARRAAAGAPPDAPRGGAGAGAEAAADAAAGSAGAGAAGAAAAAGRAAAAARAVLFVSGLPQCAKGHLVRKPLQRAFVPFKASNGAPRRGACVPACSPRHARQGSG
jgi:hypothetical protein